jgi:predicted nucleic acid-binding Zn ribbon protein
VTDIPASGADLARQALARARAAAKTAPATKPRGPKRTRRPAGGGRDPQALGGILGNLATDEGWNDNLGGGSVLDRWTELCPTAYADTTRPVAFDADTGQLTVKAASHAVAAHLRLMERQLVAYINQQIGRPLVRRVRVAVGGDTAAQVQAGPHSVPEQPVEAPVKTRETAHPGYRATLEAAQTHRPDRQPTNPYVVEAIARQEAALRAGRQPEDEHRDAIWEYDRLTATQADPAEAIRRAAIARARQERAGVTLPRRAFDVA